MATPRRSALPARDYVPKKGDFIDFLADGYTLECVSTNHYIDTKTGASVRYGLLVGWHPEYPEAPISVAYVEGDPSSFLGTLEERRAGAGAQQLRRIRPADGQMRTYPYNGQDDAYVFIPEQ